MPCCSPASWCRSRSAARNRSPARRPPPKADKPVGVLLQSDPSVETPGPEHLHRVGAVAEILRYVTAPDGNHHLIARGIRRFRVLEFLPGYPVPGGARRRGRRGRGVFHRDRRARAPVEGARSRGDFAAAQPADRDRLGHRADPVAVGAGRLRRQCLGPHAGREAGPAGDVRRRRASRQAVALSRPADRGVAAVQADRRADAGIAVPAASASTSCASSFARSKRSSARARTARPRSPSCARRSPKPACPRKPRTRR